MTKPVAILRSLAVAALVAMLGLGAWAQDKPQGRVILEVTGAIAKTNADGAMRYDRAMLEALGTREIVTRTPWTEGNIRFEGVLLRDVMADVGATSTEVDAVALNDYTVTIPLIDAETHDVILALKADGEDLTVRNRGPVWVIYPWNDDPDLRNEVYYSRSIWQLKALDVR